MKKTVKRDILIYAISFGVLALINIMREKPHYFLDMNQIFYYIGAEMFFLSNENILLSIFSILFILAIVILPTIYFILDTKNNKKFRKTNILWIILTISTFIYLAYFALKGNTIKDTYKLFIINDLLIYFAIMSFIIDGFIRLKEKRFTIYDMINIAIKAFLFVFMMISATQLKILVEGLVKTYFFQAIATFIFYIFSEIFFFLGLYTITRFIESQKGHENTEVISKIVKKASLYLMIAVIGILSKFIFIFIMSYSDASKLMENIFEIIEIDLTVVCLGTFIVSLIIQHNYKTSFILWKNTLAPITENVSPTEKDNNNISIKQDTMSFKKEISTIDYINIDKKEERENEEKSN